MANWSEWYLDSESWEPISLDQLKKDYEQFREESPEDYARYDSFDYYMSACMDYNGGSLWKMSDFYESGLAQESPEDPDGAKEALDWLDSVARKYGLPEDEKYRLIARWRAHELKYWY